MINRRTFIGVVGGGMLGGVQRLHAQQAAKVWVVGFLAGGVRPPGGAVPSALREQLRTLGFTEGRDLIFEGRWAEGRNDRLPALAAELLARKVDIVVAFGSPASEAAKQAFQVTPIIVFSAGDLVESGLVASLARPGGNVTGVNDPAAVLSGKRLEILKTLVPTAKRVAVLWNADNRAMTLRYREIERAAQVLGMTIEPLGVREPDDFDGALSAMTRVRPDALMMVTDTLTTLNRQRVLDYVSAHQIPAMYEFGSLVKGGGLISYGSEMNDHFRLAADYVARILKGARPDDLPVEQPNRYFLVINAGTARNLRLAIPQTLLLRADEVIQ